MNKSLDFEHWIRFELPKLLTLSEAKSRNVAIYFSRFADYLRMLESADPKRFELFAAEFIKRMKKVSKKQPRRPYPKKMREALSKSGYVFSKNGYRVLKRPR